MKYYSLMNQLDGNTSPGYKLDVTGDIRIASGSDLYIGTTALSSISGAGLIGVDSSSITNSSASDLQTVLEDLDSAIGGVGSSAISAVGNITSGDAFTSGTPGSELYFTSAGVLGLGNTASSAARIEFFNDTIDRISLLSSYVGIGTTAPVTTLDVQGAIRLGASGGISDTLNTISAGTAPSASLYWGSYRICTTGDSCAGGAGGGVDSTGGTGYLAKFTDQYNVENSILYESGGNIGIGTTVTGTYKVNVSGSLNTTTLYLAGTQVSATATEINLLSGRSGTLLDTNNVATQLSAWDQDSSNDLITTDIGSTVQGYNANTSFLGQTIETGEITDGTVLPADVDDNGQTPGDGQVLTYNNANSKFNWVDATSLGTNYWSRNTGSGYVYPAVVTDKVGVGNTAPTESLDVTGNIAVSGTVDGRDVSADGSNLDTLYTTIGLSALTSGEVDQLENIGATTISSTQWGYLGSLNQSLSTTDAVTFTTINTGQGANELYAMDQNVRTSDTVQFAGLQIGGATPSITSIVSGTGTNWSGATDAELVTRQAIKSYVDNAISGVTVDVFTTFTADSGSTTADSAGDTLTINGSGSISTSISGDTLTITGTDNDTTYTAGNGLDLSGTTFNLGGAISQTTRLYNGTYEYLYLNNSTGNVGIGTTSTGTYKLNVGGSFNTTSLYLAGSEVTSSAAELNLLDGVNLTLSAAEFNLLDGRSGTLLDTNNVATQLSGWDQDSSNDATITSLTSGYIPYFNGTNLANTIVYQSGGNVGIGTTSTGTYKVNVSGSLNTSTLYLSGTEVTSTASELNLLDGVNLTLSAAEFNLLDGRSGTLLDTNNVATQLSDWDQDSSNDALITSLTSGYLSYFDGSNLANSSIYLTGGNLGIGTTAPGYALDVNGDIQIANGSELYSYGSASLGNRLYTGDNYVTDGETFTASIDALDQQVKALSNGEAGMWQDQTTYINPINFTSLAITDSGRLGIGTTNPNNPLSVVGNADFTGNIGIGTTDVSTYALNVAGSANVNSLYIGGTQVSATASEINILSGATLSTTELNYLDNATVTSGGIVFGNGSNFTQDAANFFWDDSSNYLGIGTTAPSATLDLFGTTAGLQLSYDANNYGKFTIGSDGTLTLAGVSAGGSLTNIARFATTGVDIDVPTSFNATGDVSIANDLQFTNQTASYIKTYGPLTIEAGENYESNNLKLKTYNSGRIVLDAAGGVALNQAQNWDLAASTTALNIESGLLNFDTTNSRIGIGNTAPAAKFDVSGTGWIRGGTGNTTGLFVDANGQIGLGTTNPTQQLSVNGRINMLDVGSTTPGNNLYADGGNLYWGTTQLDTGATGTVTSSGSANYIPYFSTGTDLANSSIYTDGINIGIGTTAPAAMFDVVGDINISTSYKIGGSSVLSASSSDENILVGLGAGNTAPSGASQLTLIGHGAGYNLDSTNADQNTFIGAWAGSSVTSGYNNVLIGNDAGGTLTTGHHNFIGGSWAGVGSTANYNVALGYSAGGSNTSGNSNTMVGAYSDVTSEGNYNTVLGSNSSSAYDSSIVLGYNTDATSSHQFVVGGDDANGYIDEAYFGGGVVSSSPTTVTLNATGGSGTDIAGASMILAGGKATGNADGGDIIFKTSDVGSSGTSLQSLTEKMRLTDEGYLGIGTTNPGYTLDVNGSGNFTSLYIGGTEVSATATELNILSGATLSTTELNYLDNATVTSGGIVFGNGSNFTQDAANFFWDDSSNYLGIGTTAPSTTLDLFGTTAGLQLSYDANNYGKFTIGNDGTLTLAGVSAGGSLTDIARFSTTQVNFDVPTAFNAAGDVSVAYDLYFTNQTASYIKSDGPLSIVAGEAFENNDLTLETYGTGNIILKAKGGNLWADGSAVGIGTTAPARALHVLVGSTAPPVRFQDSDGYCEIDPTSTTWSCTSDATLKKDVETLSNISNLEKVKQLRPVSFKWKTQQDENARFGLIAQEVEELFPEFVQTDENGLKSVSYGSFTPILISAMQEQQLKIEGQQNELTKLSDELALVINEDTGAVTSSLLDILAQETENIEERTTAVEAEIDALTEKDNEIETRLSTIEDRLSTLEQASASASLENLNNRVGFLEQLFTGMQASGSADLSSYLAEIIDNQILGLQSDEATLSALTITGDTNVNNLAVTGELSNGLLTINGFDDSLATPSATISTLGGSLKLQHLGLGEIEFMAGKSKIDTDGNFIMSEGDLVIKTGVIKGNDQFRGIDIPAGLGSTYLDIDFETVKDTDEYAVNITPSWLTNIAVINKRTDGFRIQFSTPAPLNGKVDWMILE